MTCIGGTSTQHRFADFVLTLPTLDMDWKDINTKAFRRFPANKKTNYHALVELNKKPYKRFSSKKTLFNLHWWELCTKPFRQVFVKVNIYGHALVGP